MAPEILFDLILRGVFFILLFGYTVYGIILGYHWLTYGTTYRTTFFLMIGYIVGGIFCFTLMAPAIL